MVCIDLSTAAQERAGLGRYAAGLAQALISLGVPLTAFVNDLRGSRLAPPLGNLPVRTVNMPRKPWRLRTAASYLGLSLDSHFEGINLFHATGHLLPRLRHVRTVFTLHDTAYLRFPRYHLAQNRVYLAHMMPRFLAHAGHVIAVSESTRREAFASYRLSPAKITVIPEGVAPHFRPELDPERLAAVRRQYNLPLRFILCVGTIEPRKNLPTLLESYAALRADHPDLGLVIAGGKGWLFQDFFERLNALGLERQVRITGYVPEPDLPALLSAAEVFAYPSYYEGFGLPPLEAMACGVPVACSSASSLPEVVGDAGLLLPPDSPRAWVEALSHLLANPARRAELRARGLVRAQKFTWEAAARRTLAVYNGVMERGRADRA